MPSRDVFHQQVRGALEKDGWVITHDPMTLQFGVTELYIDLGAEKLIAAEKAGTLIAVEVKSFLGPSIMKEFHTALGQFLNYRVALEAQDPDRLLFLAVPVEIYNPFFMQPVMQTVIERYDLNIIVYNPYTVEVEQWIE